MKQYYDKESSIRRRFVYVCVYIIISNYFKIRKNGHVPVTGYRQFYSSFESTNSFKFVQLFMIPLSYFIN